MTKIVGLVPIFASGKFEVEKPEDWDSMTPKEKKDYFINNASRSGYLCHQCTDCMETDWEADLGCFDSLPDEDELFWEEDQ